MCWQTYINNVRYYYTSLQRIDQSTTFQKMSEEIGNLEEDPECVNLTLLLGLLNQARQDTSVDVTGLRENITQCIENSTHWNTTRTLKLEDLSATTHGMGRNPVPRRNPMTGGTRVTNHNAIHHHVSQRGKNGDPHGSPSTLDHMTMSTNLSRLHAYSTTHNNSLLSNEELANLNVDSDVSEQ